MISLSIVSQLYIISSSSSIPLSFVIVGGDLNADATINFLHKGLSTTAIGNSGIVIAVHCFTSSNQFFYVDVYMT